jgi:hypothetical protein
LLNAVASKSLQKGHLSTTVAATFTKGARAVSYAIENIITFSCVSAFFAGVVIAAAGLMI